VETPQSNEPRSTKRTAPYERYAAVYDQIGQRVFGERIARATLRYLASTGRAPKTAVDLACGTGAATKVFAAAGMIVTGIDRSAAMLANARRSFDEAGLDATWIERDLRDAAVDEPVELVTSFYDSLNYITSRADLATVFSHARHMLVPNGVFVFDLNTWEKFSTTWNDSCYLATDREGLFGVYQSWFEPKTGLSPLKMTFFLQDADGAWDRFDEEHVERAYALDKVETMLEATEFTVEAMLDYQDRSLEFGPPGSERSHRVVFVAVAATGERSIDEQ
jgi:SAM-dependent methyltransferase